MYLEMKDISFAYKQADAYVLTSFNLIAEKGEIVSIIGSSGSGKSTVLRLIAGLEVPARGSISINNTIMVDDNIFVPPERRNIGMVFQDYALFPHLSVSENIAFGISKLSGRERAERAGELLHLIQMAEYGGRYPHQLSGGQQQRVAVARALAPKPHLLLMDEPFSNVDSILKEKMRQEIRAILKAEAATCIFVTHDKADEANMSDRTIQM